MSEPISQERALAVVAELSEQLKYEALLADVSASFVNLPADQIDGNIENAQRRACECLGLGHASLWQTSPSEPGILLLTHLFRNASLPPPPNRMDAEQYFPWCQGKLRNKEIVNVPNTAEAPQEAATDTQTWQAFGIKSTVGFPLWIGGGPVFGVLSFDSTTGPQKYSEVLVNRLQLLAQIFANAIARKRIEQALIGSEMRLRLAASAAKAGLWTLSADSGEIWATDETKELFGLLPTEALTLNKLFDLVHIKDRESVRNIIEEALDSGEEKNVEYRINRRDVGVRWISSRGRRHSGGFGEPDQLMGVSIDITERRQSEEAQKWHSAIVRSSDDAIISMNLQGIIADWNAAAEKIYGYSAQEAIGQKIDFIVPAELRKEEATILIQLATGESFQHFETVRVRRDGKNVNVSLSISPIRDPAGRIVGASKIARDISEAMRAQEDLQKSYAEIKQLKEKLQAESIYLQEEIKLSGRYLEIVGQSKALRQVLSKVEQVAGTDSIVLITGESGTGKELVARAIHAQSKRKDQVMVKVDCASLPPTLIESELFGRERGAYTGALTRQIGRVETANGSTLFLDEIGELGIDVQAKLLRVVQDGEFERLGTAKTIHANIRIIAATHRDLAERVKNGTFREDLLYRLNVFPIHVPPLRERPEDIPLLVTAFLREFEKRMGKKIPIVPSRVMEELRHYPWPGNVRELRNVIERTVIITEGERLKLQLPKASLVATTRTLKEAEAQHIRSILEKTSWRIKGPAGAAMTLGMKPSTLFSAMRRLHIHKPRKKGEMSS
jgi:formate hydrogenlyase transcriptional activator